MTEAVTPAVEKKAAFCAKTNDGDTVTWTFSDGTFRSRKVSEYPQELIIALAAHGLSAKGGDSYASAGGDLSFGITALDRVLTNLDAGLFSGPRGSGGSAEKTDTDLVQAIANLQSLPTEQVRALLEAASEDDKKSLRKNVHVKAEIASIKAKRAAEAAAGAGPLQLFPAA